MLSRVAERMYWFGRYIERAENMARLLTVNTNLVLDLPQVPFIWSSLVSITGVEEAFRKRFSVIDERNVVRFLLDDPVNSIRGCVAGARENARTTREVMPNEVWEKVNELHLYLRRNVGQGVRRNGRHQMLKDIINGCHELTGYLAGSMSNDTAYQFIKIGRNLERADMTTRILDVGCLHLMNVEHVEVHEYESILWMNVLRSLTAYQMYRQHVQDRVNGEDVVDFLLKDTKFPRALAHCFGELETCFSRLPNAKAPIEAVNHTRRMIAGEDVIALVQRGGLHEYIDEIQLDLADIHTSVGTTWFGYGVAEGNDTAAGSA